MIQPVHAQKGYMSDSSHLLKSLGHPRHTPVSRAEELELFHKYYAGDANAARRLVEVNLKFVAAVAKGYLNRGLTLGELIAEGTIGLRIAANKFNTGSGYRFISYAIWWIRQKIIAALAEQPRAVNLPTRIIDFKLNFDKARTRMEQATGRAVGRDAVADQMNIQARILEKNLALLHSLSLDAKVEWDSTSGDDDRTLMDAMESDAATDDASNASMLARNIKKFIATLNKDEREVIYLYFGIGGQPPLNLENIGIRKDISKERVRQIRNNALAKLKVKIKRSKFF